MLDAILNRRSIRFFRSDPVSDADVEEVLKAGFCAPSAHGAAPWHVVVVKDPEVKARLAAVHRWARFIERAPVSIVVCVERGETGHFWIEDGAVFMENMMIQATSMGLGSCWISIRGVVDGDVDAEVEVRKVCGLPDHFGVAAIMPLGYAARHPCPHEPALPERRVHRDSYSQG
jgi:nitroreductase